MKLSEAILLGDSLRDRAWAVFLDMTGERPCGCALGGAQLALGETSKEGYLRLWPWLMDYAPKLLWSNAKDHIGLSNRPSAPGFVLVCSGKVTIEALAEFVASIEPECGECNRYACVCEKKEAPQTQAYDGATILRAVPSVITARR